MHSMNLLLGTGTIDPDFIVSKLHMDLNFWTAVLLSFHMCSYCCHADLI